MREIERRAANGRLEVREAGGKPVLSGYAAIFGSKADMGGYREIVAPGAFRRAIAEGDDVRALWNHDPASILGRSSAGTLRLREDDHGLLVEIDPPDTQLGRDAVELIRRGDVSQMSFGFTVPKGGAAWSKDGPENVRTILDVRLFDVSPVTFPAYPDTAIAVRSLSEWQRAAWNGVNLAQLRRRLALAEI
jgi:HK97 family phage prohead protease